MVLQGNITEFWCYYTSQSCCQGVTVQTLNLPPVHFVFTVLSSYVARACMHMYVCVCVSLYECPLHECYKTLELIYLVTCTTCPTATVNPLSRNVTRPSPDGKNASHVEFTRMNSNLKPSSSSHQGSLRRLPCSTGAEAAEQMVQSPRKREKGFEGERDMPAPAG